MLPSSIVNGVVVVVITDLPNHLAGFGALAIVLGAAADPFAQQLVHYDDNEFADVGQSAWISRAIDYTALGPALQWKSEHPVVTGFCLFCN